MTNNSLDIEEELIPVSVLTGFLGSGKTTVLRYLLQQPETRRVAVVINEFGKVGLDHLLVSAVDESTVLLNNGCLCCSIRSDLVRTLRQLYIRRAGSEIPAFTRVVVETTGLADPAPIVHSLIRDQLLADCYRLDGIVTVVDAVTGSSTLDRHAEAVKQAAVADRLLLTKIDLASLETQACLRLRLNALNPGAPIIPVAHGVAAPSLLLNAGFYNLETKTPRVRRWLAAEAYTEQEHENGPDDPHDHGGVNLHDDFIRSFCLTFDQPLAWGQLATWIQVLVTTHGADLLRVKGILNIEGRVAPVVIHGVQHLFYPPVQLDDWPDQDHRSKIVFITHGLEFGDLQRPPFDLVGEPDS